MHCAMGVTNDATCLSITAPPVRNRNRSAGVSAPSFFNLQ